MLLYSRMTIPINRWFHLGKKTFWLFLLRSGKFFILLLAGAILLTYHAYFGKWKDTFDNFFVVEHPNWYLTGGSVMMILWLSMLGYLIVVLLRAWVIYRQYKIMLDEYAINLRRGIFFVKEMVIPYQQIQNVEIKQPYLYRPFGLAELDVVLQVKSSEFENKKGKHKSLLPVIDKKMAKALANEIIHRGSTSRNFMNESAGNNSSEVKMKF